MRAPWAGQIGHPVVGHALAAVMVGGAIQAQCYRGTWDPAWGATTLGEMMRVLGRTAVLERVRARVLAVAHPPEHFGELGAAFGAGVEPMPDAVVEGAAHVTPEMLGPGIVVPRANVRPAVAGVVGGLTIQITSGLGFTKAVITGRRALGTVTGTGLLARYAAQWIHCFAYVWRAAFDRAAAIAHLSGARGLALWTQRYGLDEAVVLAEGQSVASLTPHEVFEFAQLLTSSLGWFPSLPGVVQAVAEEWAPQSVNYPVALFPPLSSLILGTHAGREALEVDATELGSCEVLRPKSHDRMMWDMMMGAMAGREMVAHLYFDNVGGPAEERAFARWRYSARYRDLSNLPIFGWEVCDHDLVGERLVWVAHAGNGHGCLCFSRESGLLRPAPVWDHVVGATHALQAQWRNLAIMSNAAHQRMGGVPAGAHLRDVELGCTPTFLAKIRREAGTLLGVMVRDSLVDPPTEWREALERAGFCRFRAEPGEGTSQETLHE